MIDNLLIAGHAVFDYAYADIAFSGQDIATQVYRTGQ